MDDEPLKEGDDRKAYNQARLSAMNMLAQREQSSQELGNKLGSRFDQSIVREVLEDLSVEGLQSDERFVESFISSKISRGQGPLKISYELRNKGVSQETIAAQLDSYRDEWLEIAKGVLQRKFGEAPPQDHKEKQKRQRFIASRGFPNEICYKLFD